MSQHGICNLSVIPLMSEPSHRSEVVSQILFGEHFSCLEERGDWTQIQTEPDHYKGWVLTSQYEKILITEFQELCKSNVLTAFDLIQVVEINGQFTTIVFGSNLPSLTSGRGKIAGTEYTFDGEARNTSEKNGSKMIVENALMYLNAPYQWGGRSPFGIDCSGLTQMVYKMSGINLKRDSSLQAEQGKDIHLLDETHAGDLAFFDNEEGNINHVGI
ncbi:MAG: C40 family peptidase, partial [Bacteroidia bacterium]|nr:C40 family peptidase [Bacteroidia bacterium]